MLWHGAEESNLGLKGIWNWIDIPINGILSLFKLVVILGSLTFKKRFKIKNSPNFKFWLEKLYLERS